MTREWRANCWKRLNLQMDAALKRMKNKDLFLDSVGEQWVSSISQLFEGVEKRVIMSLFDLRRWIRDKDEEIRQRMEKEIEDTEFRLKRGSDLGRFDQFFCITHANLIASVGAVDILLGHHPTYEDSFLVYIPSFPCIYPLAHVLEYIIELVMIFVGMRSGYIRVKTPLTDALTGTTKDI